MTHSIIERILVYALYLFIILLIASIALLLPSTPQQYHQAPEFKRPAQKIVIQPVFIDQTIESGISKPHMQSSNALSGLHESFGAGACVLDYNNDGWMDLFLINGSGQRRYFGEKEWWQSQTPFTLYKNTGINSFTDVTDTALGTKITGWGMGCAAADLDNDGNQDLIITNYGANILLKNRGDGTFADSTMHSNINGNDWSTSVLTADFNNDGLLDIYILNFIQYQQGLKTYEASSGYAPRINKQFDASLFDSSANQLYINKGNLVFEDQTLAAGLENASGKGISAEVLDINNDGFSDIFISNGQGGPNKLYINNGDLSFTDASETFKVASIQQTTGTKSDDIDRDGRFDLFVGTDNKNSKLLYKNVENKKLLVDIAKNLGIDKTETSGAMTWGVSLSDLNNDGSSDIFLANGFNHPDSLSPRKTQGQPNSILINTLTNFQSCDSNCYASVSDNNGSSRSVIPVDFDNDGDIDLYISQNNSLGQLLVNTTAKKSWLGLKLVGTHSNRDALGAIVTLRTDTKTFVKKISNTGFLSSHDKRIIFHTGNESAKTLQIHWPSGQETHISPLPESRYISIFEDSHNYTQYSVVKQIPKKSRIIFSNRLHKIGVIEWLVSNNHKEDAHIETNLILDNQPTDQELMRLTKISHLLNPQLALKANIQSLKTKNIELRINAIRNLKHSEEEISSRFLLNLLNDPSPQVVCEVAKAYQHFFREEEAMIHSKFLAIPQLIQLLDKDQSHDVKECAIDALAESENHRALMPLIDLITSIDNTNPLRTKAIDALGRLRDKKAKSFLLKTVHAPNETRENKYTAISSLKRLNIINEESFFKENLAAYYEDGEILDFLHLLFDLSNDPKHNIIINPVLVNKILSEFMAEYQATLVTNEISMINQIISSFKSTSTIKSVGMPPTKQADRLASTMIKEMQKTLSTSTADIKVREKILNDERIMRLFSSRRIVKKISVNTNDPLRKNAIIFLVENTTSEKELSLFKKHILDSHYDEDYRFLVAKGLMKKSPEFVIKTVLTER